ncbi:P-loop ATPase, Sll1717 family [Burkholderia gladioli]|uniref:P-loop ATPase, Sll1717 family n=1 Tax=Burkholderia gladioli TaxID=28095 RepID=UPI003F7A0B23
MLLLRDIYIGSTDAKNEVLANSPEEISRFMRLYVTPPALSIEKFANRQKYYISGLKGTGKTALLRYVALKLDETQNAVSRFILFKSDVDEDMRSDFSKAARVQVVHENSAEADGPDFELVWRWFIYRKIAELVTSESDHSFQRNGKLAEFCELVSSERFAKQEKTGLMRLLPALKRGTVEISRSPKLGLELAWDEDGKARINFNELVYKADQAFEALSPDGRRTNFFFDELELNYSTKKQHQRDSRLVRDLVVTIERLNAVAKRSGFNLCFYAAIRSEVLVSIEAIGKEINKPMADFGSEILWNRSGLFAEQQPLIALIEQRINTSRQEVGLEWLSPSQLWRDYFPPSINETPAQAYILANSWYRPRDVVRLLIAVQEQAPDATSFTHTALQAVRKRYSTSSWVEMTEELRVRYTPEDIEGMKHILYGGKRVFKLADIQARAETTRNNHHDTDELLKKHDVKQILRDLYRIGVLGNYDGKRSTGQDIVRYSFRGDDELLLDRPIYVHTALRAYLSV